MSAESIESTNRVLNAYVENGILFGETGSCLGKRDPVWGNGVLFGEMESCLAKWNPVWRNGILAGKKAAIPVSRDCRQWTTADYVEMNVLLSIQSVKPPTLPNARIWK